MAWHQLGAKPWCKPTLSPCTDAYMYYLLEKTLGESCVHFVFLAEQDRSQWEKTLHMEHFLSLAANFLSYR